MQLSPNATRILGALGLMDEIERHWHEPESIALVSGKTMDVLAEVATGAFARRHWGSAYGVLRRTDLQRILFDAVSAERNCTIDGVYGSRISTRRMNCCRNCRVKHKTCRIS